MRLFRKIAALGAKVDELTTQVTELTTQVSELQARMSVVYGRSSLNAERNVRTHASLQNLAEDFEPVTGQVHLLMTERTQDQRSGPEEA